MIEPNAPWSVLTAKQAEVARSFLAARAAERTHLVIYLSGAHAYGFPSPDSDLDLKCVHIAATQALVGLDVVDEARDRLEIVDGVELDYGSNELAQALRGVIKTGKVAPPAIGGREQRASALLRLGARGAGREDSRGDSAGRIACPRGPARLGIAGWCAPQSPASSSSTLRLRR